MKRCALALLGLLALPLAAAAQNDGLRTGEVPPERLPVSRFSITPYVGARVPFSTGDEIVTLQDGSRYRFSWERGGAPMVGADLTVRVAGPVQALGGFAWSGRRTDDLRTQNLTTGDTLSGSASGSQVWFAKLGVQVRLADPSPDDRRFHPSALITAAPALVFLKPSAIAGFPNEANGTTHHFAANLGADAAARIGRSDRWSFQLGVQDYLVFWNTGDLAARDAATAQAIFDQGAVVTYDYSTSNIVTLRFGVSYRFR